MNDYGYLIGAMIVWIILLIIIAYKYLGGKNE